MFNVKLSIVRNMKRLRICALVLVCLSESATLFSASFCSLACGGTKGTLFCVAASGPRANLRLVTLAAGTLSLSRFHNVRPVTLSISLRMTLESCALNVGSPIGFSAVITWAGVAAPLPLLPLLPPPHPGRLGSVVAGMLHPLEGTLRCTDVDLTLGQSF